MKKSIVSVIILGLLGVFLGSQAIAWNQNHMPQGNMGQMNNQNMQQQSGNYQEFMQNSASLRQEIANDRSELQTLMSSQNPDQQEVQRLRTRIANNMSKLKEMANSHNVPMQNRQNRQGQNNMHSGYNNNHRGNMNHRGGNMMGNSRGHAGGCW